MTLVSASARPGQISGGDLALAGLLLVLFALGHTYASHALLGANVLKSYNWVFDFDSARFVQIWCSRPYEPADYAVSWAFRHPLIMAVRPICLALHGGGVSSAQASLMMAAAIAGLVVALGYLFCRVVALEQLDALILSLWLGISAQPLMLGALPEAYGLALCGIGLSFLVFARQQLAGPAPLTLRLLALVLNAGITITNGVLPVICEALATRAQHGRGTKWRRLLFVYLTAFAVFALLAAGLNVIFRPSAADGAVAAAKQVWWSVHINNEQPADLAQIARTLTAYNLVAPHFTTVLIEPAAPKPMLDFRLWRYDWIGQAALLLTVVAFSLAALRVMRDRPYRAVWLVALGWLIANILLYRYWQYRGSIYIYGAHVSFALCAILAAALRPGGGVVRLRFARGIVLAMLVLTGANNLVRYQEMIGLLAAGHVYSSSDWARPAVVGADERRASSD